MTSAPAQLPPVGGASDDDASPRARPPVVEDYAVVHLVAQESHKDLVGPQVIDHMAWQLAAEGAGRPRQVAVGFLEPGRVAARRDARLRIASWRRRAPQLQTMLLPFVSRLGTRLNARAMAVRVLRATAGRPVVFHCRGESAAEWAVLMKPSLSRCGIVADIRGPWPEELLFERGFDGPEGADAETLRRYHLSLARLHGVFAHAAVVTSVSRGMLDWLHGIGVERSRLMYVPCCVRQVTYSAETRARARSELGFEGRRVYAYLGIITRYQHVEGGVVPFFRETARRYPDAHLLALTTEPVMLRRLLAEAGVPEDRATALRVPQHEVPRLLAAADCGLLLRQPTRLTRVTQPIKLGEYLASGLPVVVSRGTGTVDEMVRESDAGIVVGALDTQPALAREAERVWNELAARGETMRQGALALCRREFLWSSYTERVREAYRRALTWDAG